jgi:hypothetical protein
MSIVDTMFSCNETPVWLPTTLNPTTEIMPCLSCTIRLSTPAPGTGSVQPSILGIIVNENPTAELIVNGQRYNLIQSELCFSGLHRLYGQHTVSDCEYVLTFRHITDISKIILFCIPLIVQETGVSYFKTLGSITRDRPLLSSLLKKETQIISYSGAGLTGRSASNVTPAKVCSPIAFPVTWYLCLTPTIIARNDFNRLRELLDKNIYKGPPKPITDITISRAKKLLTIIQTITIENHIDSEKSGRSTKALKCYRIDPNKDVVGDRVFVGGVPAKNTLADEITQAANLNNPPPPDDGVIKPGTIEYIIGIVLGVTIGIILCATIAFHLWRGTFKHYLAVLKLYEKLDT